MMKKKQLGEMSESREDKFMLPGIDFKAKLIGTEPVGEARGDKMCLDAMIKLKYLVKTSGEHKPRIIINVSIEGIRILDEKTREVLHQHEVHRISFISRDPTDLRAFGYVYGEHGNHKFFGIKTEKQADVLVLTLKDLFEVVLDLKKKQIAEQKKVEKITGQTTSEMPIHASFKNPPPAEEDEKGEKENQEPIYAQVNKPKLTQLAAEVPTEQDQNSSGLLDLEQDIKNLQMGIDTMEEFNLNLDTPTSPQPQADQFASPPPAVGIAAVAAAAAATSDPFAISGPPPAQKTPSSAPAVGPSDPFAPRATPTPATNSAPAIKTPSEDLFKEFKDTFTAPVAPAQNPVNAFQAAMTQSTPNPFGQPAPAAPFQANFGSAFGGPEGFNAPPSAFSAAPVKPATDPFGGEMTFTDSVLTPDNTPNQLAPAPSKTSDPFSDLGALGSSKTEAPKSVKDMFTNYKIGRPGEPQPAPEVKLTAGPKRPPPAIPPNTASTLAWPS